MKKFLLIFLLFVSVALSQTTTQNIGLTRGDATTFRFNYNFEIVSTYELYFTVKATQEIGDDALITKANTLGGGGNTEIEIITSSSVSFPSRKIITVKLLTTDTDTFTLPFYYYDVVITNPDDAADSKTIYIGTMTIDRDVRTPYDGTGFNYAISRVQVENTIADLRTSPGSTNLKLSTVLGYYSIDDGGGGFFYWDAASTDTDDGGAIIKCTNVTTGRWLRTFNGEDANVKWWGAKGNLTQDATDIFILVEAWANTNGKGFYIPYGDYRVSSGVGANKFNFNGAIRVYGDAFDKNINARTATRIYPAANGDTLFYSGGASNQARTMTFEYLVFEGRNGADTANVGLRMYTENYVSFCEWIGFHKADTAIAVDIRGSDAIWFENCIWRINDISIRIDERDGSNTSNLISISNSRIIWSRYYGIHARNVLQLSVNNSSIESASMGYSTATANASTDYVTVANTWKYDNADSVTFTTTGILPAGLAVLTTYFVINRTGEVLQVSATAGGAAINITDAGSGTHTIIATGNNNNEIWLSYCKAVDLQSVYFELSAHADSRMLYMAPWDEDATIGLVTNINIYGGTQTAVTAEYAFEIATHAGVNMNLYGAKLEATIAPGLVKDTVIYDVDFYGVFYGITFGNNIQKYTIDNYNSDDFVHTPASGLFKNEPHHLWATYSYGNQGGHEYMRLMGGTSGHNATVANSDYFRNTSQRLILPIAEPELLGDDAGTDSVRVTINYTNATDLGTEAMYCEIRLLYSMEGANDRGQLMLYKASAFHDGSQSRLYALAEETLVNSGAGNGWHPWATAVIVSVSTTQFIFDLYANDATIVGNVTGELVYGANVSSVVLTSGNDGAGYD